MTGHSLQSSKHVDRKAFLPRQYRRISEPKHPVANLSKRDIGLLIVIDRNTVQVPYSRRHRDHAPVPQRLGPIDL